MPPRTAERAGCGRMWPVCRPRGAGRAGPERRGGGMVYADGSNPSVRKDIGVRLPSSARVTLPTGIMHPVDSEASAERRLLAVQRSAGLQWESAPQQILSHSNDAWLVKP